MSDVQSLLSRCRELGAVLLPAAEGRLKIRAPAPLPVELREELKQRKAEIIALLSQPSSVPPGQPYIDNGGELIIPHDCPPKYRYWQGGQSLAETLRELGASADVWRRYTEAPYGQVH
jgi:hypothetical protein